MKLRHLGLFALIAFSNSLFAQQNLTINDAVLGLRSKFRPDNIRDLKWIAGSEAFSFVEKTDSGWFILKTDASTLKSSAIVSQDQLNRNCGFSGKDTLKVIPPITWESPTDFRFQKGTAIYRYSLSTQKGSKITSWPATAENLEWSSNLSLAYTSNKKIYVLSSDGKSISTGDTNLTIGQSVHRNEFGIAKGLFWSNNSQLLAYYAMDERMVEDYPIPNWESVPATFTNIKYPMAGRKSHQVKLVIFNPSTGKEITLKTGEPLDHYLTNIAWDPTDKFIYIAELNREQNHLWLNKYDVSTGEKVATLFEETDTKYVEPLHAMLFVPNGNGQFVWFSNRDGHTHLYLFDAAGKLMRQLTKGDFEVLGIQGFTADNKSLIISANQESYLGAALYAVNLAKGGMTLLTPGKGTHTASTSYNGKFVLDSYTDLTTPLKISLLSNAKEVKVLSNSPDKLKGYNTAQVRLMTIKSADGVTDLPAKLMLPSNFDSTKKYPVIVYLYGGPHAQMVKNSWPASGNLWYDYMTEQGFIVFVMDNRGSEHRSKAFEQATFRQLGTAEMDDQLKGVAYLKSLPYVDTTKMGVHGWSFGGFMTTSLMLRHPGTFQAAVAGGPVIDWSMYEIMYTERYMDSPQENQAGYDANNLLTKVSNLKGDLLLIHGTQDDVVVWQHSIKFLKACVDKGVQVDYFVYPGHPHNVSGVDRVHLMDKISKYFMEKLK